MDRREALACGAKRYVGEVCKKCTTSERYTVNRACVRCLRVRKDAYDLLHPDKKQARWLRAGRNAYARHKTKKLAYSKVYTASKKAERRAFIDALKNVPCHDCGMSFPPYVMDFDHVSGKSQNIGIMLGWKKESILAEAAKCEVVCSNCHRLRTHARGYAKFFRPAIGE